MPENTLCPCCQRHSFVYEDFFETCPVCLWQDDGLQKADPNYAGGANRLSLNDYRKQWLEQQVRQAVAGAS